MPAATLDELLSAIGESSLQLVAAPRGRDIPVAATMIHEPRAPLPRLDHALVLAVGLRPTSARAEDLVRESAEAGLTGVVVKRYGDPVARLMAVAEEAGIALLTADDHLAWHQLDTLVTSALSVSSSPERDVAGPAMGDLFALANAIAATVGGATTIEDPQQRILAYSTLPDQPIDEDRRAGILGLLVPDVPVNEAQYRQLARTSGVSRFAADANGLPRLAVPVRAGGELLGSIWVVDTEDGVGARDEQALVEGAAMAALHLLRSRASDDLARRQRGELLRRVLDDPASAAFVAPQLGLDPEAAVAMAAFIVRADDPDGVVAARSVLRLTDLVSLHCEAYSGRHGCTLIDRTVYALLPADGPGSTHRELVADIARRAQRALRVPVRAGLGSVTAALHGAAESRREADLVLRALDAIPDEGGSPMVASIAELRAGVVLVELAEWAAAPYRLADGVGPAMIAYDAAHGTAYASTLLAYFESDSQVAVAAQRLNVHPNTCRYRLGRAEQLFGFRLADPDERLVLWLQLRLARNTRRIA
jgi:GAF domain-containing protein